MAARLDNGFFRHAIVAHERAVERAEIADHQLAIRLEQFAMLPADQGMIERQIGGPAASHDRRQLQVELFGFGFAADND